MYKHIIVWSSFDKVAQKMTELSEIGYEYDSNFVIGVRMKKTDASPKKYKFIYDKKFTPDIEEYYKASGWQLHKIKFYNFVKLAEGDEGAYPIFSDIETELEILRYRLFRFSVLMLIGFILMSICIACGLELANVLTKGFDNFLPEKIARVWGDVLSDIFAGFFGAVFGFGLGGLVTFTQEYFRLQRDRRENLKDWEL